MQIISKHLIWTLPPRKIIQSITRPILQPSISGKLTYACPEEKWNKLERELSKKTRLKREKTRHEIFGIRWGVEEILQKSSVKIRYSDYLRLNLQRQ